MDITIDRGRCVGAGMCVLLVASVFDQDAEDGKVTLLDPAPRPDARAAVLEAAQVCPSGAITVAADQNS
ncbi:ferredoxin [Nocardia sp. NPDC049149]|uniref:ferredoxin n=1 Tax=Nocardia sp. NPDC049149 TaxID=3364315 RepID=UPI00371E7237